MNDSSPRPYFDITIDSRPAGRIVFELFQDVVPKTTDNFLHLCLGDKGTTENGAKLSYEGSGFHRVIKGFMLQVSRAFDDDGRVGGMLKLISDHPLYSLSYLLFLFSAFTLI
jgi:cyclophilin family peptidyl-prolyl cis-trans isomerase